MNCKCCEEAQECKLDMIISLIEKWNNQSIEELPDLLPKKVLAQKLCVDVSTINRWMEAQILRDPIKIGGRLYFKLEDVKKLIEDGRK